MGTTQQCKYHHIPNNLQSSMRLLSAHDSKPHPLVQFDTIQTSIARVSLLKQVKCVLTAKLHSSTYSFRRQVVSTRLQLTFIRVPISRRRRRRRRGKMMTALGGVYIQALYYYVCIYIYKQHPIQYNSRANITPTLSGVKLGRQQSASVPVRSCPPNRWCYSWGEMEGNNEESTRFERMYSGESRDRCTQSYGETEHEKRRI